MVQKYVWPLCLVFFLFSKIAVAQQELKGFVTDEKNEAVPYATVVLLKAQDSAFYKGTFTEENGEFIFSEVEKGKYLLKVTFVGFEDLSEPVEVDGNIFLQHLILKEATSGLDEVVVHAKNPTVRRTVDRIIFNVENTSLSTGNTWNILKKTPGVLVMEDNLMVRNSTVAVYINDRKVHLSASELKQLLENYDASNIEAVEVITNPPAKYDAEGGAVLNIVTSKGITPGYKGSVNTSYTQAIYPKYSFGTSHFFKNEKLNLFANYSYNPRKEFKDDDIFINYINEEDEIFSKWRTDFDRTTRSKAHQANLVLDYQLSDKDEINFTSNLLYSPEKTFQNQVNTIIYNAEDEIESILETESFLESDERNMAFDLGYKHYFENSAEFSVNTHYTNFFMDRIQEVYSYYLDPEGAFLESNFFVTDADQNIHIYTAQADFTTPIAESSLSAGTKISVIDSESGLDFYNIENGTAFHNPDDSDLFLYNEKILSAYSSWEKNWSNWSLKAGLRAEQTWREGFSVSLNEENDKSYFDIFPTFYLQHVFSEKHSMTFDYGRRIQRPRYESLNPFPYYLTEYNYNSGNPNLLASKSHNFNLNYTFKNQYFFDIYYRDNGENAANLVFQDNEDFSLRTVYANVLESTSYGLDISHGRSISSMWYFYGYVSAFYEEEVFLGLESENQIISNSAKGIFVQLYNYFTLTKDRTLTGELTFVHWPTFIMGSYQIDPKTTVSIGFRKTIWDKRAEITLNFEDILDMTNSQLVSRYANQFNGYFAKPETRYVRIGFKYNFGNYRLEDNNRGIEAAERDRL